MSSGICSQGLVLATAMVVSSTVIFLTFSRQKTQSSSSPKQTLRSCLSSDGKKRGKKKKKKKVRFAENVKEPSCNGEEYRKEQLQKMVSGRSRSEVDGFCRHQMPANRVALYTGILRDRVHVHRMECSY